MAKLHSRSPSSSRGASNSAAHVANANLKTLTNMIRNIPQKLRNNDYLMEAVAVLVKIDKYLHRRFEEPEKSDGTVLAQMAEAHEATAEALSRALSRHEIGPNIAAVFKKYKLSALEMKILLLASCSSLGLGVKIRDADDVLQTFCGRQPQYTTIFPQPRQRLVKSQRRLAIRASNLWRIRAANRQAA